MITASELQTPRPNIVRVYFEYADFRVRIDDNSPVHYETELLKGDPQGTKWVLNFRIFALDRKGRLILFEYRWTHSYLQTPQRDTVINALVEEFASPLNALPGRIEVH